MKSNATNIISMEVPLTKKDIRKLLPEIPDHVAKQIDASTIRLRKAGKISTASFITIIEKGEVQFPIGIIGAISSCFARQRVPSLLREYATSNHPIAAIQHEVEYH